MVSSGSAGSASKVRACNQQRLGPGWIFDGKKIIIGIEQIAEC
jgi:hypothetical protein